MTADDRFVEGGYIPRSAPGLQRITTADAVKSLFADHESLTPRARRLDAEVARHLAEVHADWYRIDRPMDAGLRTLTRGIGAACLLLSAIIIFAALAATTPW